MNKLTKKKLFRGKLTRYSKLETVENEEVAVLKVDENWNEGDSKLEEDKGTQEVSQERGVTDFICDICGEAFSLVSIKETHSAKVGENEGDSKLEEAKGTEE